MSSRNSSQTRDYQVQTSWHADSGPPYASVSTNRLEAALKKVSDQAVRYEDQMKDLESKLSENLSNFRAMNSLLQDAFTGITRNSKRAERALNSQVPHINNELDESLNALGDLEETLPTIKTHVADIRVVYDSGQRKAQSLVVDLTWLNTEFYERWRSIIFTCSSPVSWRWKTLMRFLFAISFLVCSWLFWLVVAGAYRAHRHRLVWGERLMS